MSPSPGPIRHTAPAFRIGGAVLAPSAVLAILDRTAAQELPPGAASAWDAAWIACLTNSPRWAEAARREFDRTMSVEV